MPSAARLVIDETPILAASKPVAPALAVLAAKWETLNRSAEEAWRRFDSAAAQAQQIMPDYPKDQSLVDLGRAGQSAVELWEAQADAIERAFGVPKLEAEAERAQTAANSLADEIANMRPNSVAEAALKFNLLRIRFEDGRGGFDQPSKIHDFQGDLDYLARMIPAS